MNRGTDDRSITIKVGCVVAWGLWTLTVTLLGIGTWVESIACQSWGLASSAAAATATIRQYFVAQNRLMRTCFELGVDMGRAEGATPLRR